MAVLALDFSDVPGHFGHLMTVRVEAESGSGHGPVYRTPKVLNGWKSLKIIGSGLVFKVTTYRSRKYVPNVELNKKL